jgi:bifunctional non-homologous end joining protein LigD
MRRGGTPGPRHPGGHGHGPGARDERIEGHPPVRGLDATRTSDEISAFARELARALEADDPDLVVSAMSKPRPGKVFVDWSQNNAAKTTIAPTRSAARGADGRRPRTWAELDDPDLRHLAVRRGARARRLRRRPARPWRPSRPIPSPPTWRSAPPPRPNPSRPRTDAFGRAATPRPAGAWRLARSWRFVMQEHHASRCTSTSGSSATACSSAGPCRAASRRLPTATTWRS